MTLHCRCCGFEVALNGGEFEVCLECGWNNEASQSPNPVHLNSASMERLHSARKVWFRRHPSIERFFRACGRSLLDFGIDGYGLAREQALEAIELLERQNIPVLGGDVLIQSNLSVKLTHDNWYTSRDPKASYAEYVSRTHQISRKFISSFPESLDGKLLFLIVVP